MIKKMQVPAYWPFEVGAQSLAKRGVVKEVKKVMYMSDMYIGESICMCMSMSVVDEVEEGMAMDMDMDIVEVVVVI